jgi:hypothetical protein
MAARQRCRLPHCEWRDRLRQPAPRSTGTAVAPTPAPRLYIHYRAPEQAAGVAALRKGLAKTQLAGRRPQVIVPPGEPASTYAKTALVCERASDCALAPKLADVLGRVLGKRVPVNDVSARYGATTRSRVYHYEIWFDRQPIVVSGAVTPTAAPSTPAGPPPQVPRRRISRQPVPVRRRGSPSAPRLLMVRQRGRSP